MRNTGSRPGREVVQAYLAAPPGDPGRPVRELAAFGTVTAAPGERAEVHAAGAGPGVRPVARGPGLGLAAGPFTVQVGRSSRGPAALRAGVG